MPPPGSQSQHKRNLAVKRQDGEPLTRVDLQYDMLHAVFTDENAVFTDPHTTIRGDPAGTLVTFRDLYVNALIHSPKCSKASREKIRESPDFGNEFAMISLLSNVGRINTTMAFFPEMKTALRTYHPVPALQRTNGNLQDAPRIKNILKSCFIPGEEQGTYSTPSEVLARSRSGNIPPTSIVNLIFVFSSHSPTIARSHFPPRSDYEFLDLFTPVRITSQSRARAFLWLCYHYHEAPPPNPFNDDSAVHLPDQIPPLVPLTEEENIDTQEEHQRGIAMTDLRKRFLETQARGEYARDTDGDFTRFQSGESIGSKGKEVMHSGFGPNIREASPVDSLFSLPYIFRDEDMPEGFGGRRLPSPPDHFPSDQHFSLQRHSLHGHLGMSSMSRATADPYPRRPSSPSADVLQPSNGKPLRTQSRKQRGQSSQTRPPLFVHEPYQHHPSISQLITMSPDAPKRSMLEQAWHVSMTTDPLLDSDDEVFADENTRLDYVLRLRIISRLRGKEPTPPRDITPANIPIVHPLGTR